MRLIDADELSGKIADLRCVLSSYNDYNIGIDDAEREVDHAPTVEAVPIPCKVGDEVWCLRDTRVYNKPVKGTVTEIYFRDNMDMCIVVRRLCRGRWGERVFATEQEAQAAIDRRLNDGNL